MAQKRTKKKSASRKGSAAKHPAAFAQLSKTLKELQARQTLATRALHKTAASTKALLMKAKTKAATAHTKAAALRNSTNKKQLAKANMLHRAAVQAVEAGERAMHAAERDMQASQTENKKLQEFGRVMSKFHQDWSKQHHAKKATVKKTAKPKMKMPRSLETSFMQEFVKSDSDAVMPKAFKKTPTRAPREMPAQSSQPRHEPFYQDDSSFFESSEGDPII